MARESDTPATGAPAEHIHDSICDTVGETPLVRLHRLPAEARCEAEILGKLEFLNPLASVKDRIALAMVEAAERAGKIRPGHTTIVEPTSGNTGIALAFVCAAKGYRLVLTMPESMSLERRKMLKLFGAELGPARGSGRAHPRRESMPLERRKMFKLSGADLERPPPQLGLGGPPPAPRRILAERPDAVMLQQFENPANPAIHRRTTAEEI